MTLRFLNIFMGMFWGLERQRKKTVQIAYFHHLIQYSVLQNLKNKLSKSEDGTLTSAVDRFVMLEISDLGKVEISIEKAGANYQKVSDFREASQLLLIVAMSKYLDDL